MRTEVATREQFEIIAKVASWSTIHSPDIPHLIHTYRTYVRNVHVCSSCSSALWNALKEVKALHASIRAHWENKNASEDVDRYKQDAQGE